MNQNIKKYKTLYGWQFKFILTGVIYKILDELNFFHLKFSQLLINRSIEPLWWNSPRRNPVSTILYYID